MLITNPFALALTSILIGVFIGICICVIAFLVYTDLHYTDAEYEQLCDECCIQSRKDR